MSVKSNHKQIRRTQCSAVEVIDPCLFVNNSSAFIFFSPNRVPSIPSLTPSLWIYHHHPLPSQESTSSFRPILLHLILLRPDVPFTPPVPNTRLLYYSTIFPDPNTPSKSQQNTFSFRDFNYHLPLPPLFPSPLAT